MSEALDRQRKRELRGTILRALNVAYARESNVTLKSLAFIARRKELDRELIEELQYLIELGYAAAVPHPADVLDRDPPIDYRLTAQGKRILNGDLEDKSIEI